MKLKVGDYIVWKIFTWETNSYLAYVAARKENEFYLIFRDASQGWQSIEDLKLVRKMNKLEIKLHGMENLKKYYKKPCN